MVILFITGVFTGCPLITISNSLRYTAGGSNFFTSSSSYILAILFVSILVGELLVHIMQIITAVW